MHKNTEKLIKFTSSMKGAGGRENKVSGGGPPSADLLVCFPSRAHLALMPKPISSPKRPISEAPNKRHHLKMINTRSGRTGGGPASPLVWAKGKQGDAEVSEPTSPKVTCAGQIKVRPRISSGGNSGSSSSNCRNWQSVMEEIERIHSTRSKHTKKSKHWGEALGFKKDVMNFLTCLGNIRFDFRCFGSFPDPVDVSSDDEDEEEEEEEEEQEEVDEENNTVFSKWYMVLQENQNVTNINDDDDSVNNTNIPEVPPANALLLMRCRSAPAKRGSWLQERENVISKREAEAEEEEREKEESEEALEEEEEEEKKEKKRESLAIVMKYDTDFYKLSSDVSQETWLVGGLQDAFSRSRSWKR